MEDVTCHVQREKANHSYKKLCFVPLCKNTSIFTPSKIFVNVPKDLVRRKLWLKAARRDCMSTLTSTLFCCEDHFNMEDDMEHFLRFKMMGGLLKSKPNTVPHIFECQPQISTSWSTERKADEKRNRLVSEAMSIASTSAESRIIDADQVELSSTDENDPLSGIDHEFPVSRDPVCDTFWTDYSELPSCLPRDPIKSDIVDIKCEPMWDTEENISGWLETLEATEQASSCTIPTSTTDVGFHLKEESDRQCYIAHNAIIIPKDEDLLTQVTVTEELPTGHRASARIAQVRARRMQFHETGVTRNKRGKDAAKGKRTKRLLETELSQNDLPTSTNDSVSNSASRHNAEDASSKSPARSKSGGTKIVRLRRKRKEMYLQKKTQRILEAQTRGNTCTETNREKTADDGTNLITQDTYSGSNVGRNKCTRQERFLKARARRIRQGQEHKQMREPRPPRYVIPSNEWRVQITSRLKNFCLPMQSEGNDHLDMRQYCEPLVNARDDKHRRRQRERYHKRVARERQEPEPRADTYLQRRARRCPQQSFDAREIQSQLTAENAGSNNNQQMDENELQNSRSRTEANDYEVAPFEWVDVSCVKFEHFDTEQTCEVDQINVDIKSQSLDQLQFICVKSER